MVDDLEKRIKKDIFLQQWQTKVAGWSGALGVLSSLAFHPEVDVYLVADQAAMFLLGTAAMYTYKNYHCKQLSQLYQEAVILGLMSGAMYSAGLVLTDVVTSCIIPS